MKVKLNLETFVNMEDLAHQIAQNEELSYDMLKDFIVALDQYVGDLDFTELVLHYFMDEWEKHKHLREDNE